MSSCLKGPLAVRASSAIAALAYFAAGPTSANRTSRKPQAAGDHTQLRMSSAGCRRLPPPRRRPPRAPPCPPNAAIFHAKLPGRGESKRDRMLGAGGASAKPGQPWLASTCPIKPWYDRKEAFGVHPCTAGCAGGRPAAPAIRSCCTCRSRSAAVGLTANRRWLARAGVSCGRRTPNQAAECRRQRPGLRQSPAGRTEPASCSSGHQWNCEPNKGLYHVVVRAKKAPGWFSRGGASWHSTFCFQQRHAHSAPRRSCACPTAGSQMCSCGCAGPRPTASRSAPAAAA